MKKNRSGSLWLDNFVRFAPCGFGFHRIPRAMSNGRQIHADNILGTNLAQSHGCIRALRRDGPPNLDIHRISVAPSSGFDETTDCPMRQMHTNRVIVGRPPRLVAC